MVGPVTIATGKVICFTTFYCISFWAVN
jgi:hypothetical protein